ncbi:MULTISPECIES: DNA-directed RNA polymerase subunit delta [Sediminibacillus]|uniref:DNA-directed RNA polymerase subunit delta n=1 Tax=Sediminibacillus TaxID=482460 RepID=UPI00129499E1|nr:DNA-directed RNA polymerase subunit delta [Sediminibacillus terrae]
MSLTNYSHEEITGLSMIELASEILAEEKKAKDFREVYDRIAELKGFTEAQKDEYIAQFYTDLNTDGRFLTLGSNLWGLKEWYPIEQVEEEITEAPKKKKKKKAKAKTSKRKKEDIYVEEEIEDDLDELEEDLDFDDIDTTDEFADDNDDKFDDDDTDNADDDDEYDGDFRSGKLDDEDQKVVEEDVSYVGDEDDDDANDDNYN